MECGGEERRLVMAQGVQEPQDPAELTGDTLHRVPQVPDLVLLERRPEIHFQVS